MYCGFKTPSHGELLVEQEIVQAEKNQSRLLSDYSNYLFPGQGWRKPLSSPVVDFVRPIVGDTKHVTLKTVLDGLSRLRATDSVRWVDMGGGRALPMRQLNSTSGFMQRFKTTNVDLFDFGLDGLLPSELEELERLAPGATESEAEPVLITENVETVTLSEPADIITSIELMQYLNDPLAALTNWYNLLDDNGVMMIATEHAWCSWIRYKREPSNVCSYETPIKQFLKELLKNGINFAITKESDWPNGTRPAVDPDYFRIMAIQKKPGTFLRVTEPVTDIWVNPYKFKAVYYETPDKGVAPIVEVCRPRTHRVLGAMSLEGVS
jgi:hypothetical protein